MEVEEDGKWSTEIISSRKICTAASLTAILLSLIDSGIADFMALQKSLQKAST